MDQRTRVNQSTSPTLLGRTREQTKDDAHGMNKIDALPAGWRVEGGLLLEDGESAPTKKGKPRKKK